MKKRLTDPKRDCGNDRGGVVGSIISSLVSAGELQDEYQAVTGINIIICI